MSDKHCKNCKHIKNINGDFYEFAKCSLNVKNEERVDLVSGDNIPKEYFYCSTVRSKTRLDEFTNHCGPDGQHFEPREATDEN